MTVQLPISYEVLLELVEQLPPIQQKNLLSHLLSRHATQQPLSVAEKLQLFEAAILDHPVNEVPSVRRVDWYGDDGCC